MIIANGTITCREEKTGYIDAETGHPVKLPVTWGCPVPCQWMANTTDRRGVVNGERFTLATYTVLVEGPFHGERVRLCDPCGRELGEFAVKSEEWLEAVGQTRVII